MAKLRDDTASEGRLRRAQARRALRSESAPDLFSFLTQVSRRLAGPLDVEGTLTAIASESLPYFGAWSIVDVIEPDGSPRRVSISHPDPELQPCADRLKGGWPPEQGDPLGAPRAVRTKRTEVIGEVSDEMLVRMARDEQNLLDLRTLGIGSVVVVPLLARGNVLGAMTFVSAEARGGFHEGDVELAEDLAARCAIALDNARLLHEVENARDLVVGVNERLLLSSLDQHELAAAAAARMAAATQFLATLSHEIRTPVSAIIGYATLLSDEHAGPVTEVQRRHLERIRESADHLTELLTDLLDLKRLELGRLSLDLERAALPPVVLEALGMVRLRADEARVSVELELEEDGLVYVGDQERVRQILLNLISNAVKFTDPDGRVRVTCGRQEGSIPTGAQEAEGPWVVVRVEDTGVGIPEGQTEDVFEPFVQLGGSGKGGAGMGLPISRDLARRMGGDVTVRSREKEGSCFTLWLPEASSSPT